MTERVKIVDLKLDSSIWPRSTLNEEAIERYRDCLQELPPIVVDRETMTVLDGWHRLEAYKREGIDEITPRYIDCPPHLFLAKAFALNAKHGLPVENEVRDQIIIDLRQEDESHDPMSEEAIAEVMGLSFQRVSQVIINILGARIFIKDKPKTREAIRLYLSGVSQAKVAERFKVSQPTISSVVREYTKRKDLISEHRKNRSHLKSVVNYPQRGPWGDIKFRGNTSGYLLVDLIDYYQPKSILDPMEGSGTTGDVAFDTGDIPYLGLDIQNGFDLVGDEVEGKYDLIFWHPPYYGAMDYSNGHPNELSSLPSYEEFLAALKLCMAKLVAALTKDGRLAILYGDGKVKGTYQPTTGHIVGFGLGTVEAQLVKLRENVERSRYFDYGNAPFIPTVHENVLLIRR